jgi:O-acetyl-ADP-ribose deacetylase (regulator of RNase III)
MITEVNFDVLEIPVGAVFHCCNCFNTMGAGVALSVKSKYPEAFGADSRTVCGDKGKLGKFSSAKTKDEKMIYNLYGQYHYGSFARNSRQLNYEAFYQSIELAQKDTIQLGIKKVAIPYKIGCSLAGGEWKIVRSIFEYFFEDSSHSQMAQDLFVCKL